jgi:hypothetical protein
MQDDPGGGEVTDHRVPPRLVASAWTRSAMDSTCCLVRPRWTGWCRITAGQEDKTVVVRDVSVSSALSRRNPQVSGLVSVLEELPGHDHALDRLVPS